MAGTKLDWYTMPMYPLMCMLAGLFIAQCFEMAGMLPGRSNAVKTLLLLIVGFGISYYLSYSETLDRVMKPQVNMNDKTFSVSHYLQLVNQKKKPVENLVLLYSELEQEMIWYDHIDSNMRFESVFKLKTGDEVVAYMPGNKSIIEGTYTCIKTDEYYDIYRYRITGRLPDSVIANH